LFFLNRKNKNINEEKILINFNLNHLNDFFNYTDYIKNNDDMKEDEKYQFICQELEKEKRNLEITKTRIAYYSLD
jgi:hypothetical protein